MDDGLLQAGQLRIAHFHAEIAARHHHHVGSIDDFREVGHRLVSLDLCNDARLAAGLAHQRARLLDVGRIARE